MRVLLSDVTRGDEFVDFLRHSGFDAVLETAATVLVSLPPHGSAARSEADADLFLSVWLGISLRVWHELWPDAEAIVVAEPEPARGAVR